MSQPKDPFLKAIEGVEALLRAASDGLALWRASMERRQDREDAASRDSPGPGAFGRSGPLQALRGALRREQARWAERAEDDPAARRLHDLCAALLDVLDDEARDWGGAQRPPPRRARKHSN